MIFGRSAATSTACFQDGSHILARRAVIFPPNPSQRPQSRLIARRGHSRLSKSSSLPFLNTRQPIKGDSYNRALSAAASTYPRPNKTAIFTLVAKIHAHHFEILNDAEELELLRLFPELADLFELRITDNFTDILGHLNQETLHEKVRLARQQFGDSLPKGNLNEEELAFYTRLYGEPKIISEKDVPETVDERDKLFRDDGEGGLVEVEMERNSKTPTTQDESEHEHGSGPHEIEERLNEAAQLVHGNIVPDFVEEEDSYDGDRHRSHPLTTEGKFATSPTTIFMPVDTIIRPVKHILSSQKMKHIKEAAYQLFEPSLSKSTSTPRHTPQEPIPLYAGQRSMSITDSNVYLATIYPGVYATSLSILTEVRKRLGTKWLRDLMYREGGPRVLDAGGAGAGIQAWRDVLTAEWSLMYPNHPPESQAPLGRSTVLVGSDSLRHSVSRLLDNTTFIPRIPDYLHAPDPSISESEGSSPRRKNYDVIIASHALMRFPEDYMCKEYIKNLWSLLNPEGGVLILVEKGIRRGFEVIGGAREMILNRVIASPGSTTYERVMGSGDSSIVQKEKGMIIAPCTNHSKCPMQIVPGSRVSKHELCRFSQRYIQPFVQRQAEKPGKNHEDIQFCYLAVQRGADPREDLGVIQGESATDTAFSGYESAEEVGEVELQTPVNSDTTTARPHTLSLPRLVLPPIKRKGHVSMDLCTPAGKIERWVVSRSFGKQSYRDARKSQWGDLWALGAKSRSSRTSTRAEQVTAKGKGVARKGKAETTVRSPELQADPWSAEDVDIPDFEKTVEKFERRQGKSRGKGRKKMKNWTRPQQDPGL